MRDYDPFRIDYVNPKTKCVVLVSGEALKIVTLMDCHGKETQDHVAAMACVAGPDTEGRWYSIDIHDGGTVIQ